MQFYSVKIWFGRKKILNYAYVLKNGVGRYNVFFLFLHKACWILLFVSFSYRIRQCFCSIPRFDLYHVLSSSTNNFAHAQTLSRMSSLLGRMNIVRVNIGFFTGFKKIKQRRISFVPGYLRMILWKISTAISIKHQIHVLATFNIKKNSILTACMYAFNSKMFTIIFNPEKTSLSFYSWGQCSTLHR
jgi:hypothetical protein